MEILYAMLQQLSSSLTLPQFLLILFIILVCSIIITVFVTKHTKKDGILAFLNSNNTQEMSDIKTQLTDLSTKLDGIVKEVKQTITAAFSRLHEENEEILEAINTASSMKTEISTLYTKLSASINDLNNYIQMQNSKDTSSIENVKIVLQHSLDIVRETHTQIEKLDYYIRDQLPQFRTDNKEFSKELADLSKDLALVERSIQTQMNTVRSITLRQ